MEGSSRGKGEEFPSTTEFTPLEFTLVELSISVQILHNIELTTILANPDKDLPEVVKDNMHQYISGFNDQNLINSSLVQGTFDKILEVI